MPRHINFYASCLLRNVNFEPVSRYKCLGVPITHDLSWASNIEYVINNRNPVLGYLKQHFPLAPSTQKVSLHTSLLSTIIEYAPAIKYSSHTTR